VLFSAVLSSPAGCRLHLRLRLRCNQVLQGHMRQASILGRIAISRLVAAENLKRNILTFAKIQVEL